MRVAVSWRDHTPNLNDEGALSALLLRLTHNPFGAITEMDRGNVEKWRPFDFDQALAYFRRGREPELGLRGFAGHDSQRAMGAFEFIVRREPADNSIVLSASGEYLEMAGIQVSAGFLRQVALAMPTFFQASGRDMSAGLADYVRAQKLPRLPEILDYSINWYYLLSLTCYQEYYTREDLLAAPAYRVEELDNGWIELICYDHPLRRDTPENLARIDELTRYLDERAHY